MPEPRKNEVPRQLEGILRQPEFASFIEDLQKKIESQPQYLDQHQDETFEQTLAVLSENGHLDDVQPSKEDVRNVLRTLVRPKPGA